MTLYSQNPIPKRKKKIRLEDRRVESINLMSKVSVP